MLTDLVLKRIQPAATVVKKADGGGLYIHVDPKGSKLWRLAYRFDGKQKLLSGGRYPDVALADARKWRDEAKRQIAAGEDPSRVRKAEKRARRHAAGNSFELVAREWHEIQKASLEPKYAERVLSRLVTLVFPSIGSIPITEVSPGDILDMIRLIEKRGTIATAHRVRVICSQVFRHAIAESRATKDPARDIIAAQKKKPETVHMPRLRADEMPEFFAKFADDTSRTTSRLALHWTIMTMVRTNETRFAEWKEIEGLDTADAIWRIPKARMKMNAEHIVPLVPQMVALLKDIRRNAGPSRFLFPNPSSKSGVLSENTMLIALDRMGYKGRATVHGFRGVASTVLNEQTRNDEHGDPVRMFDADWIERQLAHVERSAVRGAYNAAEWLAARRRMMAWWCDWLDSQAMLGSLLH